MKKLENHRVGVDQGEEVISDFQSDGDLWTGDGPREVRRVVQFATPYRDLPRVMAFVQMWDISNTANARVDVQVDDITVEGFTLIFRTWLDTRVARVRIGWMSFGELPHDDDWQLY